MQPEPQVPPAELARRARELGACCRRQAGAMALTMGAVGAAVAQSRSLAAPDEPLRAVSLCRP